MDQGYPPYGPPQGAGAYTGAPPPAQVGPGIPGHAYPYAPAHSAYASAPAPGYPYGTPAGYSPSGVLIYPAPRPQEQHPAHLAQQHVPEPTSATAGPSGKRKRKTSGVRDVEQSSDEDGSDAVDQHGRPVPQRSMSVDKDGKKRTKTQRACDSCRSRKIRCDVLSEEEPPVCQHCKQYGFECTFFLPITETRFKKKRLEEEAAAAQEKADAERLVAGSPRGPPDAKIWGNTSPAYLVHSQTTINPRIYESWDQRYHHSFEITTNGDGIVLASQEPPSDDAASSSTPKQLDLRLEKDLLQRLVNAYFTDLAPLLPVVTKAEFLAMGTPPPILFYSMCLLAAARRDVPQSVFDSLRHAVNYLLKHEDVLSTTSVVHVQVLLILCMMADVHSPYVPQALSCLWIRLGAAIRMAQDLGFHRAESLQQNINLRRRLWAICVVSDRWISLAYGHPSMIDVNDCDTRLPSSGDAADEYMDHLVRLSVILGRVLKTIYSPSGLMSTNDDELQSLLKDITDWRTNLPDSLKFRGPDTPRNAGLLHLLYSCLNMIFWRVFMRISYSCPEHLKFALTINEMTNLVALTDGAIDWLDRHDTIYDQWLLIAYASTSCALVQYHTWVRRKDPETVNKLRMLRDYVRRWESSLSPDHMSARRKTAEIITLLFGATQGAQPSMDAPAPVLNPTPGAKPNQPFAGLEFRKDPSRPGGGVFVAKNVSRGASTPRTDGGADEPPAADEDEDELLEENGHPRPLAQPSPASMSSPATVSTPGTAGSSAPAATPAPAPTPPVAAPAKESRRQPRGRRPSRQQTNGPPPTLAPPPPPPPPGLPALVGFNAGLGGPGLPNVNPAMDGLGADVRVMNALDMPSHPDGGGGTPSLDQLFPANMGFLESMPTTSMFDWGQWDSFFQQIPMGMDQFQQPPSGPLHGSPMGMYHPPPAG